MASFTPKSGTLAEVNATAIAEGQFLITEDQAPNDRIYYDKDGSTRIQVGGVDVDSAMSLVSTNPVQNAVISTKVGTDALTTTAQDTSGGINELNTNKLDKTGDSKDNTVTFTEAVTLENIATTESHATLFGKIKKFFSFIGTTALTTTDQTVSGAINEINNNLTDITSEITWITGIDFKRAFLNKKKQVLEISFKLSSTDVANGATLFTIPTKYLTDGDATYQGRYIVTGTSGGYINNNLTLTKSTGVATIALACRNIGVDLTYPSTYTG